MDSASSIQQRVRARMEAKQVHRTTILPVDGYNELIAARYRALTYRELKKIASRNAHVTDEAEAEILIAASILAEACEEVYEVVPGFYDVPEDERGPGLGFGWGKQFAEWLGLSHVENPRQCVLALFVDDLDLIAHRNSYVEWRDEVAADTETEVAKNSEA